MSADLPTETGCADRQRPGAAPWHVVVIGGGISGLAVAHALRGAVSAGPARDGAKGGATPTDRAATPDVTVLEAGPEIGGKLRVSELDGLPVDEGAESVLARRPEAVELIRAVGLEADLVYPATTAASVWTRGALRPLPAGTVMGVPTDLSALAASGILSLRGLARVPLDHLLPRTRQPAGEDVAVGAYVRARLGREVSERLVDPLLGGVYAGRAEALSLEATVPALAAAVSGERSLLKAAAKVRREASGSSASPADPVFASVRGGLGRLPAAVAAASGATILTGTTVREIARTQHGWRLTIGSTDTPEQVDADAVVIALPAAPAARLLAASAPGAGAALGNIPYASVAVASYVYARSAFPRLPPGSGVLVPSVEGRLVKAATLLTSKWGWLGAAAGPDRVVVRASVGRHREEAVLQRESDELLRAVAEDLGGMTGLIGEPIAARLSRWGGGLPQYQVGHVARAARARDAAEALPGVVVCGAAYDGIGVAACVAGAQAAAARLLAWRRATRE